MAKTSDAPITEAQMAHDAASAGQLLAAQPTKGLKLPQNRLPEPPLPDEMVIFNGYRYDIPRGVYVEVPQTVYDILEQAGRI